MSILGRVIGTLSGGLEEKLSEQLLFDKTIGFRGIKDGVGCSTFVFNTACGLIDATKYNVCIVDTNLLYPTMEFLLEPQKTEEEKDIMDFSGDNLSQIAYKTRYSNIYLVSFKNRVLADMLSSKECQATVEKLFESLKMFFDIILVDLSHEPTWATTISALKCNRIYTILTPDVSCLSVLQKSMNSLASTGVPVYKMRKVIINRNVADVNTGVYKALKSFDLQIMGDVPFSVDIARYGLTGTRIWGAISNRPAVTVFNKVIDGLLDDICQINETNAVKIRTEAENVKMEDLEKASADENISMFEDEKPTKPVKQKQSAVEVAKPTRLGKQPVQKPVQQSEPSKPKFSPFKKKAENPVLTKPPQTQAPKPQPQPSAPVEDDDIEAEFDLFED